MIEIITDKDYQNVKVVSVSLGKLDKLLTCMKRKIDESIGHYVSVLDLYEWVGVSFFDVNAEMMNWAWTSLEEAEIGRDIDGYVLSMPPARKRETIDLKSPFPCVKRIEDICENNKLREEINSKIIKYSELAFDGHRYILEYCNPSNGPKYRVEYTIPYDSPCFMNVRASEEVENYLDERENKARKELIDRVIKDMNKGDVETMPTQFDLSGFMDFSTFTFASGMTIGSARVRLPKISNIEMYNDRVVKVTFDDGSFTKSVCQENDIFDLDVGITVCLMKKMLDDGKGNGTRIYNDIIRDAHKLINNKENEKIEKQIEKDKQKKKAHKAMMKKQAKKMKAKEEAIDIQKQAYIRALQETGMIENVE